MPYVFVALPVAFLVAALMPFLIQYLEKKALLDIPNDRSSHTVPTPRGGGWLAIGIPILALAVALIATPFPPVWQHSLYGLIVSMAFVMAISAADDRRSLSPRIRFVAQIMAAALVVFTLPADIRVLPLIPQAVEQILLLIGVVWMMNLTNFMDGINGITSVNGIATALGFLLLSPFLPLHAALIIGGLMGFLVWNWGKARIFMGDVGSVPLGLWLAYGLMVVAAQAGLITAILLAFYPVADATYTLLKRLIQKKKVWEAHREHFYQQAVQNGRSHARTSTWILAFNGLCILLVVIIRLYPDMEYYALPTALVIFAGLAYHFTRKVAHAD